MMKKRVPLMANATSLSGESRLIYSEDPTSFTFLSPWLKSAEGTDGLQKYYQVFLSAADTDNFWSGTSTLSSTPLSSVDYFGLNSSLSARFPAFSGYNVIDFGGQVERNDATQQIKVNISALSAAATGHFQFVITAPGGLVIFPAIQYGPNAKPDAPAYYIQSNSVPITPTPTQTYTATLTLEILQTHVHLHKQEHLLKHKLLHKQLVLVQRKHQLKHQHKQEQLHRLQHKQEHQLGQEHQHKQDHKHQLEPYHHHKLALLQERPRKLEHPHRHQHLPQHQHALKHRHQLKLEHKLRLEHSKVHQPVHLLEHLLNHQLLLNLILPPRLLPLPKPKLLHRRRHQLKLRHRRRQLQEHALKRRLGPRLGQIPKHKHSRKQKRLL